MTGPEERFSALVEGFADVAGVTRPAPDAGQRFGSDALKVHGSIFAMLTRGQLVVKLPRDRVEALIRMGIGGPFTAGQIRPMKEWVCIAPGDDEMWRDLAQEAAAFVRALRHPTTD